jgi:ubiquitin-protein ligase
MRRRLLNDYKRMERLREKNLIDFSSDGNPPERYKVRFSCRGLFLRNGVVANSILHEVEIYIPARYPLVPPELRWLTPIFHPNILGSDHPHYPGKVCLGGWSPSQFLDELCMKLIDMIEYRNYNVRSPINAEAAVWANRNEHLLPLSSRPRKKEPGIPIRFID